MLIRTENPSDFSAIYELVRAAFSGEPHAEGDEQDFIDRQRAGPGYIPLLSLVAVAGEQAVGQIMLTRISIVGAPDRELLLLAIVSVARERRRQGIGSRLIEAAFERARELNYKGVIVLGDPAYYHRFGFASSVLFGIANANGFEDQFVMATELVPGALAGVTGVVTLPQ